MMFNCLAKGPLYTKKFDIPKVRFDYLIYGDLGSDAICLYQQHYDAQKLAHCNMPERP